MATPYIPDNVYLNAQTVHIGKVGMTGSTIVVGDLNVSGLITAPLGITGTNVFSSDTDLNKLNLHVERLYQYFFKKTAEESKDILDDI
jgi:hypothetical protein